MVGIDSRHEIACQLGRGWTTVTEWTASPMAMTRVRKFSFRSARIALDVTLNSRRHSGSAQRKRAVGLGASYSYHSWYSSFNRDNLATASIALDGCTDPGVFCIAPSVSHRLIWSDHGMAGSPDQGAQPPPIPPRTRATWPDVIGSDCRSRGVAVANDPSTEIPNRSRDFRIANKCDLEP
jgi:hypothetical protein